MLSGELVEEVARLKQEVPGEISVPGSIQLVQSLLAHDLVDEIHLMMTPVVLGHGRHLWAQTPGKSDWKVIDVLTFGDGVLFTTYERIR